MLDDVPDRPEHFPLRRFDREGQERACGLAALRSGDMPAPPVEIPRVRPFPEPHRLIVGEREGVARDTLTGVVVDADLPRRSGEEESAEAGRLLGVQDRKSTRL